MKSLTSLLVITIAIALYFMYIKPTIGEVRALIAKKEEYTNVLDKAKELKQKRDEILTDYNNISEENINKLNKIIPETFDNTSFVNEMNVLSERHNLKIEEFKEEITESNNRQELVVDESSVPYKTNKLTLKVSGRYSDFLAFLNDIESDIRLIDTVSLAVTTSESEKETSDVMDYLLELNAYSLR